jgi:hypothetical protein
MYISKLETLKLYSNSTYENGIKIGNVFKGIYKRFLTIS